MFCNSLIRQMLTSQAKFGIAMACSDKLGDQVDTPRRRPTTMEPILDAHDGGIEQVRVRVLPDGRMTRENAATYLGMKSKTLAMCAHSD